MRALPHEKSSSAMYNTPNLAPPKWHRKYRTADSITLDNCKISISTVIKRASENTLKKFGQKKCGMNHATLHIYAFHHVEFINQHMRLCKGFKLAQLE